MADKPQILISTGNALVLAAVGALLHNLGKITPQFLEKELKVGSFNYLFQHILHLIDSHCPSLSNIWEEECKKLTSLENQVLDTATVRALTSHSFRLLQPLDDRSYVSGDLVEYLGVSEIWYKKINHKYGIEHIFPPGSRLTHLMQRAHHGASGGEKEGIWTEQQLGPDDLYLATPMGWEVPAPNQAEISNLQRQVEQIIQNYLLAPNILFPIQEFADELRPLLSQAIADTRRPLNDVTVWDIGLSGMAFLLTQAIGLMAHQRSIDHDELAKIDKDNSLFWRVLGLRTDGFDFLNNAPTLADLRVRYRLLQKSLDKVRRTLEKMPVAVEIYRDENGSFFIFPDLPEQDYRIVQQALEPDLLIDGLRLAPILSEKLVNAPPKDTGGDYIGDYIQQQIMTPELPRFHQPDAYIQVWQEAVAEICLACGMRPQGYGADSEYYREKAISRHLCYQCMKERSGVAERWVQALNEFTVWIDEVADDNGRAALLVGSLGIEVFVPSIVYPGVVQEQKYPELQVNFLGASPPDGHEFLLTNRNIEFSWNATKQLLIGPVGTNILTKFRNNSVTIHYPRKVEVTIQDITFDGSEFVLELQENLTVSGLAKGDDIKCWGQDFVVTGNQTIRTNSSTAKDKVATSILWGDGTYLFTVIAGTQKEIAELKVGARSQSFARLRRVWETTRHFWQEVLPTDKDSDVVQSVAGTVVGLTGPRLEIRGTLNQNDSLGLFHTYELVLGPIRLSVVWDPDQHRFITCDNLTYAAMLLGKQPPRRNKNEVDADYQQRLHQWGAGEVHQALIGTLTIEEPVGYGSKNKEWGTITVEQVQEIKDGQGNPITYTSAIPILAEPRTFMALVPADKALAVVDAIRQKYEREMGKVRNRLPLHLGVVYFHRRTPLRAALDAGRWMLEKHAEGGKWQVRRIEVKLQANTPDYLQDKKHFARWRKLHLERDGHKLIWRIPLKMGDGQTEDYWYPYVCVETNGDDSKLAGRQWTFTPPNGGGDYWLVHASELQENDEVYFTPSTFDFEFLDTTGRRFEIHYDDKGRRVSRPTRPWLLDDMDRLEELWQQFTRLSRAQINQVIDTIENARDTWQVRPGGPNEGVFRQFVSDTLAGAEWPEGAKWKNWPDEQRKSLIDVAVPGVLTDLVELHLHILKEKE
jgi:hypothetical protein